MFKKIPLWDVFEDGLILTDGSIVNAYKIRFPSYEGVDDEDLAGDVNILSQFLSIFERPHSVFLSFISETTLAKKDLMDRYGRYHASNPVNKVVAEERDKKLKDRLIRNNYLIICYPVFKNKSDFAKKARKDPASLKKIYSETERELEILGSEVERFFLENYNYSPIKMTGREIWRHIYMMLNPDAEQPAEPVFSSESNLAPPSLREQLFLSDTAEKDDADGHYISYNGSLISTLSLDVMPDGVIPPGIGSFLFSRINFPARITLNIELPNQVEAQTKLSNMRKNAVTFVFKKQASIESERNQKKADTIDEMFQDIAAERLKIAKVSYQISFMDDSPAKIKEHNVMLTNMFSSELKGSSFYADHFKKINAFVSSLGYFPLFAYGYKWTTTRCIANLIPCRGSFLGTVDEPLMLMGNRWNGITAWSPVSRQQNKWSAVVIGPSGSGKSFFVNYLLAHIQSLKPVCFVFDLAPMSSYQASVENYNGEYVEVNPGSGSPQTINPLDFKIGNELAPDNKLLFLEKLLSYMLSDKNAPVLKEELDVLRKAVKRTYQKVLQEEKKQIPEDSEYASYQSYVDLRDAMLQEALTHKSTPEKRDEFFRTAEYAHRMAMPNLEDLATVMAMDDVVNTTQYEKDITKKLRKRLMLYTDGAAKKLICGNTNFNVSKDYVVVNIGFLKDDPNLLVPTYLTYREYAWDKLAVYLSEIPDILKKIYGEEHFLKLQQRYKFMIIDEYHNLNANKETIQITDKDFRQGRTYGISVCVITQALKDVFYEGTDEKVSIFENAANKIFLRHTSPENPQNSVVEYVVSRTGMGKSDRELFTSLRKMPGEYSEAFLFSEDIGKGVVRIEPVSSEIWKGSTDKRERYLRDMLISKLKEKTDKETAASIVIGTLSRMFPHGLLEVTDEEKEAVFNKAYAGIMRNWQVHINS